MPKVSPQPIPGSKPAEQGKERKQFIYSLVLIFLIPLAIIANTFLNIQKLGKNLDTELEQKAFLVKSVFGIGIKDDLDRETFLQEKIDQVTRNNQEIMKIAVLRPQDEGFQVVASSEEEDIGLVFSSLQYTTAWIETKDATSLATDKENKTSAQRIRSVISPLADSRNEKIALLEMKFSYAKADELLHKTIFQTLIILAITIFFILLLLFNHFSFFEYAVLLKKLREVDRMKDNFISMASHELKTPMAAIKGYMGMIFEGVAGKFDKKAQEHLHKVWANIRRLDGLINALLDVSRLEQQRMQFDMRSVSISKIIGEVISEIKVQADEKKLTLEYQPLREPRVVIFADQDRLAQIFENVIGNAIKYTFKGGIKIYHQIEGNNLLTIVQDTGIGISKTDMKGLFGQFYRVLNEKTAEIPGTGLGLWITREIIQRMNGDVYAASEENVGSIFTIVFPIMKETRK